MASVAQVVVFDDGRESDEERRVARRQGAGVEFSREFDAPGSLEDGQARGGESLGFLRLAGAAVIGEGIRRPVAGRGKIEFAVSRLIGAGKENLEAGLLPEAVAAFGMRLGCGDAQARDVAGKLVTEPQPAFGRICSEALRRWIAGAGVRGWQFRKRSSAGMAGFYLRGRFLPRLDGRPPRPAPAPRREIRIPRPSGFCQSEVDRRACAPVMA